MGILFSRFNTKKKQLRINSNKSNPISENNKIVEDLKEFDVIILTDCSRVNCSKEFSKSKLKHIMTYDDSNFNFILNL
jgi:hypothetical protein